MEFRSCVDCKKLFTFEEFCRENPSLNQSTANEIWNNPLYSIYCIDCFYKRPEQPFKIRGGYHRRYYRKLSW